MKIPVIAVSLLALCCIGAQQNASHSLWQPAPHKIGDIAGDSGWLVVPKADIYEVVTSQVSGSLVRDMPQSGSRELTVDHAKYLTGHYYVCPEGKRPFLLRAVYPSDEPGRLRAERKGNDIAVVWGGFGMSRSVDLKKSAIIVNLDFTPEKVYNEASTIPTMP